jgi:hypothetical protein
MVSCSSIAIDHLANLTAATPRRGLAYIYFNYKEEEEQKKISVFSCILRQLAGQCNRLSSQLKMLFDTCQRETKKALRNLHFTKFTGPGAACKFTAFRRILVSQGNLFFQALS